MHHFKEAKGLLSARNGMNIYRGCTHGCIYCDSRSKCYHIEHDFEDIEVKINAPELLESALKSKRKKCMISTGSMCDSYIPLENTLRHTRKCLEIIDRYGFGLSMLTKSCGILRDLDIFKSINGKAKCVVETTLTTFDEGLCKIVEPGVSTTRERARMLKTMRDSGIPAVVWLSPFLPFINDTEENLRGLLDYCEDAAVYGIIFFGTGMTLREGNREYYYSKLDEHFPGLSEKYHKKYGYSYVVPSDNNGYLTGVFKKECKKRGIVCDNDKIFAFLSTMEEKQEQMSLFNA
ncbi:MAG: radical SAM protein [Oscillospiraceae bacterium]|nr:radical SAM protein [Oscillospiraceae bacterium]